MRWISLLLFCSLLLVPVTAQDDPITLTVDAATITGEVSPYVYGVNHGPWANVPAEWLDTIDTVGATMIRFPGGNWGDQNFIRSNHLRDLFFWGERMGVETYSISVNLENGDPETAADLVRRVNIEGDTYVKYWSIGNEPNLFDEYSTEQHNREWREFAEEMLDVDSTIAFIGPDISQYQGNPQLDPRDDEGRLYLDEFLIANGDLVEIVSVHRYPFPRTMSGATATLDEVRQSTREWETIPAQLHATVLELTGEAKPIAVTEINSHWSPAVGFDTANDSHYNAIWWADVLGQMIVGDVYMINYFSLQSNSTTGGYGLIGRFDARPTYYTYRMYQHFGTRLVAVQSSDPDVSLLAALNDDGALTLLVVNLSDAAKTATIDITGFATGAASHWLFDLDHNAEEMGALDLAQPMTLSRQSITAIVIERTP